MAKLFRNNVELQKGLEHECRLAMLDTIEELTDVLKEKIETDIYGHQEGSFYERTNVLLDNDMIISNVWNDFGRGIGGIIRFDEDLYNRSGNTTLFQHGNIYLGALPLQSYLEIVNEQNDWYNPFQFPSVNRGSFWDDFLDYIDSEGGFNEIYKKHLSEYVNVV